MKRAASEAAQANRHFGEKMRVRRRGRDIEARLVLNRAKAIGGFDSATEGGESREAR